MMMFRTCEEEVVFSASVSDSGSGEVFDRKAEAPQKMQPGCTGHFGSVQTDDT